MERLSCIELLEPEERLSFLRRVISDSRLQNGARHFLGSVPNRWSVGWSFHYAEGGYLVLYERATETGRVGNMDWQSYRVCFDERGNYLPILEDCPFDSSTIKYWVDGLLRQLCEEGTLDLA